MTLAERIAEREKCAVAGCDRHREADSLFCREHLNDMWANRLHREPDGTFVYSLPFRGRLAAKDYTGSAA